ncbi:MAG TPA: hypothetical protein VEK08_18155 [Planctomycetota bacterium]|nr:hypothetical protein [Planctomycetota bacterium]
MPKKLFTLWLAVAALSLVAPRAAQCADDAAALVKSMVEGDAGERDKAEKKLRDLGAAAVPALKEAKAEKEEVATRVRNLLTDILLDTAKIDPADAATLHEVARQEGKAKRYSNAERLYRRAAQLYDKLKDDADTRKDRAKEQQYGDKRRVCDRMKDKAGHKLKGSTHTGVNLGFVRVGKDHDMSDDWE